MRTVIFEAETFEPITVANMLSWRDLNLPEGSSIVVPIFPRKRVLSFSASVEPLEYESFKTVTIRFERFVRQTNERWLAFTGDAETALLLKAAFLPGQNWAVQEMQRDEFVKGFVDGLRLAHGL